jgi:hypothetical protein
MAVITGRPGSDTLTGTEETDLLLGLGGADFISGREGDDIIFAGGGDDTVAGDNSPIPEDAGEPEGDPFGPLPGEAPGNNLIFAASGNDSVLAGFGNDGVSGGEGSDTIDGYGAFDPSIPRSFLAIFDDGSDLLSGDDGDDLIRGGGGDDWLNGGHDADTLVGGVGVDRLSGGADDDVFVFGRMLEPGTTVEELRIDTGVGPGNRDIILDFQQGKDLLDLSAYENFFARPGVPGDPVFLGTDPFMASFAPQIRYEIEDGRTVVQIVAPLGNPPPGQPPSTPSVPGAEIELVGEHQLTADDLILA